jgi:hypothetical protein
MAIFPAMKLKRTPACHQSNSPYRESCPLAARSPSVRIDKQKSATEAHCFEPFESCAFDPDRQGRLKTACQRYARIDMEESKGPRRDSAPRAQVDLCCASLHCPRPPDAQQAQSSGSGSSLAGEPPGLHGGLEPSVPAGSEKSSVAVSCGSSESFRQSA